MDIIKIETLPNSNKFELNMYGYKDDKVMLNSKHKVSINDGGLLNLNNYITICDECLLNYKIKSN